MSGYGSQFPVNDPMVQLAELLKHLLPRQAPEGSMATPLPPGPGAGLGGALRSAAPRAGAQAATRAEPALKTIADAPLRSPLPRGQAQAMRPPLQAPKIPNTPAPGPGTANQRPPQGIAPANGLGGVREGSRRPLFPGEARSSEFTALPTPPGGPSPNLASLRTDPPGAFHPAASAVSSAQSAGAVSTPGLSTLAGGSMTPWALGGGGIGALGAAGAVGLGAMANRGTPEAQGRAQPPPPSAKWGEEVYGQDISSEFPPVGTSSTSSSALGAIEPENYMDPNYGRQVGTSSAAKRYPTQFRGALDLPPPPMSARSSTGTGGRTESAPAFGALNPEAFAGTPGPAPGSLPPNLKSPDARQAPVDIPRSQHAPPPPGPRMGLQSGAFHPPTPAPAAPPPNQGSAMSLSDWQGSGGGAPSPGGRSTFDVQPRNTLSGIASRMQPDASQEDMMALVRLIASASGIENTEAGYQGMKEGSRLTMPEGYDAPAPFKGPGFKVKAKKKRRDPPPPKKRGGPAGTPEALRKRRGSRRQPELDLA